MKTLLSSWYLTVGAAIVIAAMAAYVHFLHGQLGDTTAALQQRERQLQAMTESVIAAGEALEQESTERTRLAHELRASQARFRDLEDDDWLEWKEQPLPQAVLERYR
jgi:signal transduction histidine kinase